MKQTAMQEHIEWLKATIEIAEEQCPILVNTLKLCLNDATQSLEMEKEQSECICVNVIERILNESDQGREINSKQIFEDVYQLTFKSE